MSHDYSSTQHLVGEPTYEGLARYIEMNNVRNILVMAGAGISVAAGIPDFRSPDTGIYANLKNYGLSSPTDAFSLSLLRKRPDVFYSIVRDLNLWPGQFSPTAAHYFIKLLADEGRLLRCCTQNIDGLEQATGLPRSMVVEAHGSFATASCIKCRAPYDINMACCVAKEGGVPRCEQCNGVVKPDVVLFGECLPKEFFGVVGDLKKADLLLIMGTSLQVKPFSELAFRVPSNIPRVLINRDRVGGRMFCFPGEEPVMGNCDNSCNCSCCIYCCCCWGNPCCAASAMTNGVCRDIFFPGDCQESVRYLAAAMGLGERLEMMVQQGGNNVQAS